MAQLGTRSLARLGATVLLVTAFAASCGGSTTNDPTHQVTPTDGGSGDGITAADAAPVRPEWLEPDVDTRPVACEVYATPEIRTDAVTCGGGCAAFAPPPRQSPNPGECGHASDCRDGVNGSCTTPAWGGSYCAYDECFSDDDCAAGEVCICGVGGGYLHNTCVRATCSTTDDCAVGEVCTLMAMPSPSFCETERQFHCTSSADECHANQACPQAEDPGLGNDCVFDPALGHRTCQSKTACPL